MAVGSSDEGCGVGRRTRRAVSGKWISKSQKHARMQERVAEQSWVDDHGLIYIQVAMRTLSETTGQGFIEVRWFGGGEVS